MPTLSFITPGQIDHRAFSAFGLSSKDQSKIGRFGTGLKYAISIILRAGGSFQIVSHNETLNFSVQPEDFRGTEASFVYVNGDRLPFTTDLGKDWKMWMAYRELFSNTLDEGGRVEFSAESAAEPQEGETSINIKCNELLSIYFNHELYFIDLDNEKPLYEDDSIQVYPGQSNSIFYKGISIYSAEKPFAHRYNFKGYVSLSEDRTASSTYSLMSDLARVIAQIEDESIITAILKKDSERMESRLEYREYFRPSAVFTGVAEKLGKRCVSSARILAARHKLANTDRSTIVSRNKDAFKEAMMSKSLAKLSLAGGDASVITPAIAVEGEVEASYKTRDDGLVLIAESYFSSQALLDKTIFSAYCDLKGRMWLINEMLDRVDGQFN